MVGVITDMTRTAAEQRHFAGKLRSGYAFTGVRFRKQSRDGTRYVWRDVTAEEILGVLAKHGIWPFDEGVTEGKTIPFRLEK
jgi:hypothetical protein